MKKEKRFSKLLLLCFALGCLIACNGDDSFADSIIDDQESLDTGDDDNTDDGNTDDGTSDNNNSGDSEGDEGEITLYNVEGSSIVKAKDYEVTGTLLVLQNDVAKHNELWELTKKVIPANQLTKVSEFLIFSGESNETLGFVTPTSDDLSKWQYGLAIDLAYKGGFNADGELVHTVIHEFGHIITLNIEQVDSSISDTNCMNFFTGEGCAKSDSFINKLQTQFWADIWDEFLELESEESRAAFYTKYQDRYVSDYAATNPGEDIAEVFATFVIRAGGVNGTSIAEQKIELMYSEEELTGLRDYIRANDVVAKGSSFLPTGRIKRTGLCGTSSKLAKRKL